LVRLENSASEAAELRTRLELTERTQPSVEEEKNRLEEELARKRGRVGELQAALEAERSKGFWQRPFRASVSEVE